MMTQVSAPTGWWRATARALVVVLLLSITTVLASPTASAGIDCATVKFVGVAGSGQSTASPYGYGPENRSLSEQIERFLALPPPDAANEGGYSATWIAYPAASVNVLVPSDQIRDQFRTNPIRAVQLYKRNHYDPYMASVDQGVAALTNLIGIYSINCPHTKLIVSGYSQGALVVHRAVNQMYSQPNPAMINSIAAVALIADPARTPRSRTVKFGSSSPTAQGVETYLKTVLNQGENSDIKLPSSTANICDQYDIVCDFNASQRNTWELGVKVHTTNYNGPYHKGMRNAAFWIAGVVRAYNR